MIYLKRATVFLHAFTETDFNRKLYSKTRLRDKKNTFRYNVYLHFADTEDNRRKINAELYRGRLYFRSNEGLLFGAYVELAKLGTIEKIPTFETQPKTVKL